MKKIFNNILIGLTLTLTLILGGCVTADQNGAPQVQAMGTSYMGDNLGNHIAIKNLNMKNYDINNVGHMYVQEVHASNESVYIGGVPLRITPSGVPYTVVGGQTNAAVTTTQPSEQSSTNYALYDVLASVVLGNEGFRRIGALGGYTLEEFTEDIAVRGAARDTPVFTNNYAPIADLTVVWNDGDVYDPLTGYYHLNAGTNVLADNTVNYAYWNISSPNNMLWTTGTRPVVSNNIVLATFVTSFGMILHDEPVTPAGDLPLKEDEAHAAAMPSLIVNGVYCAPIGTNLDQIVQVGGTEYHDMQERVTHASLNLTNTSLLVYYHTNVGNWVYGSTNVLPVDQWDNGTNLVPITTNDWYRGVFVSVAGSTNLHYIYPQAEYTNYEGALAGDDPNLPLGFDPYIPKVTAYIFEGGDISLRNTSDSWVDRRFMIRRGTIAAGGAGAASIPSLFQVLTQGAGTGGIQIDQPGDPSAPNHLARKGYVDSTINNINNHRAYVDAGSGNDGTALLESSIKPFKTIQAAINACAVVASPTDRYVVTISPDIFTEDVVMSNYIGLLACDIEATVINGSVTYPPAYTDATGAEIQQLTITKVNGPALVVDSGSDTAYAGIRSCYLVSTYDNDAASKSVVRVNRGQLEIYGTTYNELNLYPTNGSEGIQHAQIFEHTADPANQGLIQLFSYGSPCIIQSDDENDDISLYYTHHNQDPNALDAIESGVGRIYLNTAGLNYSNKVKLADNEYATGRARVKGVIFFVWLPPTNECKVLMAYNNASSNTGSAIVFKDNGITALGSIVPPLVSNCYLGAATTTNDTIRILNSSYVNVNGTPTVYTNDGSSGQYSIVTPTADGDMLFGGAMDLSTLNSAGTQTPLPGHLKVYADTVVGLEQPYFIDSTGNKMRIARDLMFTARNAETDTLQVGEAVYIYTNTAVTAHYVKRAKADSLATMPCVGIVADVGGIEAGVNGRIMKMGRTEIFMDTSMYSPGQPLYVSDTVAGGITNVAPAVTNIKQQIGWCNRSGVANGTITVHLWNPDTLGGKTPFYYETKYSNVDAVTVGGFTPEQLTAAQGTYYVWGSTNGPFPGTKLASLESPMILPAWTSTVVGVTNNMVLGMASLALGEMPRILPRGLFTLHLECDRNGDSSDHTISAGFTVYESNQVTVVTNVVSPVFENVPTTKGHIEVTAATDFELPLDSTLNRYLVFYFYARSGWTGETIHAYTQDGYLTRISMPIAGGGVFANDEETVHRYEIGEGLEWSDSPRLLTCLGLKNKADSNLVWGTFATLAQQIAVSNNLQNLINAKADSNLVWSIFYKITDATSLSNNLQALINSKADSNLVWGTFATLLQQIALSNNLQSLINTKADSNLVWNTFFKSADATTMSNNLQILINAKADSNLVYGVLATKADSNLVWSTFATLVQQLSLSNNLQALINAKADSNLVWGTFATLAQQIALSNNLQLAINVKADSNTVWNTFFKITDATTLSNNLQNAINAKADSNIVYGVIGVGTREQMEIFAMMAANWTQTIGAATAKIVLSNEVADLYGEYDPTNSSFVLTHLVPHRLSVNLEGATRANGDYVLALYENGAQKGVITTYRTASGNGTDNTIQGRYVWTPVNATNIYTIFLTSPSASTILPGTNGNNWISVEDLRH